MPTIDIIHFSFWFTLGVIATLAMLSFARTVLVIILTMIERRLRAKIRRRDGVVENTPHHKTKLPSKDELYYKSKRRNDPSKIVVIHLKDDV